MTYSHEEFLIAQQTDAEQQARLLRALNDLSKRQREALYLKFFDGFSYEHIAEVMSFNPQSGRNLVFNALKTLCRVLAVSLVLVGLLTGPSASGQWATSNMSINKPAPRLVR